jgi:protein-tyrosine phosphatase
MSSNIINYETLDYCKKNVEYYGLKGIGKLISYTQPVMNSIWGSCFEINEIVPGVFISDFSSACETEKLKDLGITHIVTAILGVDEMYPDLFKYHMVDICDRKYYDIKMHFNACSEFIEDAIQSGGKVLVHCLKGASRSAALVAAYLIAKKNYTCTAAIGLMKEKRKAVNPNDGFIQQLMDYEQEINKAKEALKQSLRESVRK